MPPFRGQAARRGGRAVPADIGPRGRPDPTRAPTALSAYPTLRTGSARFRVSETVGCVIENATISAYNATGSRQASSTTPTASACRSDAARAGRRRCGASRAAPQQSPRSAGRRTDPATQGSAVPRLRGLAAPALRIPLAQPAAAVTSPMTPAQNVCDHGMSRTSAIPTAST